MPPRKPPPAPPVPSPLARRVRARRCLPQLYEIYDESKKMNLVMEVRHECGRASREAIRARMSSRPEGHGECRWGCGLALAWVVRASRVCPRSCQLVTGGELFDRIVVSCPFLPHNARPLLVAQMLRSCCFCLIPAIVRHTHVPICVRLRVCMCVHVHVYMYCVRVRIFMCVRDVYICMLMCRYVRARSPAPSLMVSVEPRYAVIHPAHYALPALPPFKRASVTASVAALGCRRQSQSARARRLKETVVCVACGGTHVIAWCST